VRPRAAALRAALELREMAVLGRGGEGAPGFGRVLGGEHFDKVCSQFFLRISSNLIYNTSFD